MADRDDESHEALREELGRLTRTVAGLSERLARLERERRDERPAATVSAEAVATEKAKALITTPLARRGVDPPRPERKPPRVSRVSREQLPVLAMGIAGGVALLMGLLYFVWHSIRQGWLSPEIRLVATGAFGLAAMGAGWRLAARSQRSVAASLAGAGLGGWFGAVLVARHTYGFLGPGSTFVLLACGAALGLAIASHRGLRFLATLAAFGAFLTPLVIDSGSGRLNEAMAYQLVVVFALFVLEGRRRWPELGHLALVSTWILLSAWAGEYLADDNRRVLLVWSFVVLVLGHAQAAWLLVQAKLRGRHGAARLWVNGFASWTVGVWATSGDSEAAWVGLAMAACNAVVAVLLLRRVWAPGSSAAVRGAVGGVVSPAWIQLWAFGQLYFETDRASIPWWTAQATIAAVLALRSPELRFLLLMGLPFATALGACLDDPGKVEAGFGFWLAALPLAIALWPTRERLESASFARSLGLALLLVFGGWVFDAVAWAQFSGPAREGLIQGACLVALLVILWRCLGEATGRRFAAGLALLAALIAQGISFAIDLRLLGPVAVAGNERTWQGLALVGVAVLATWVSWALRSRLGEEKELPWIGSVFDTAGLIRAAALVVAAMLCVSALIHRAGSQESSAGSWLQAGWSVVYAVAALSLLVQGLFVRRVMWRRVGIAALFFTAAKLVLIDLTHVQMAIRVLSFMGLGLCFLAGAYAYRRLGSWIAEEA